MGPQSLTKQPSESRLFSMDFSPLLGTGETVVSVTSVTADQPIGAGALTISDQAAAGKLAQARIAGGTDGFAYKVTFLVQTSASNVLEAEGILQVEDL